MIEEDFDIRSIISQILEKEGYDVTSSAEYLSAEAIAASSPNVILIDAPLNYRKGEAFCLELKRDAHIGNIPILLMSTAIEIKDIAREYGATGYIAKPFDLYELIAIVKKQIKN